MSTGRRIAAACLLAAASMTEEAAAQAADTARTDTGFEEIVVTSTRRAQRLQDVPLAVTALTGATLDRQGLRRIDDYIRLVPGVSYNDNGPNAANITMRGVSTANNLTGPGSTVEFLIDDVVLDTMALARSTIDLRLFDMERVEVLRGPQGTLFGSGSLSGAVRMITRKPNLTETQAGVELTAQAIDGGGVGYDANAMVNAPIVTDKLAIRAVGYSTFAPGYVDNVTTRRTDQNYERALGGRVQVRFEPTDWLNVTAKAIRQQSRPNTSPLVFYNPALGGGKEYAYDGVLPHRANADVYLYDLSGDANFGWARLYSTTSYSKKNITTLDDGTGYGRAVAGAFGLPVATLTARPTVLLTPSFSDVFSQELRLSSENSGPFRWTVGGFYLRRTGGFRQALTSQDFADVLRSTGNLLTAVVDLTQKEQAGFGEVSYTLDKFEFTAGVRVFRASFNYAAVKSGLLFGGFATVLPTDFASASDNGANPKFAVSYKASPDLTLYAQASKGYRIGGYNTSNNVAAGIPKTYGSDSLWNYEVGAKSSMLNNRLTLNAAAYYIDWTNIQIPLFTTLGFTGNAGNARSIGLEVEASYRPVEQFMVGTSFSISNAELTKDVPTLQQPTGVIGVKKGDRLPSSAEFTISSFAEYHPGYGTLDPYLRVDHQYVGAAYSGFGGSGQRYGDYHLVNLRGGITLGQSEISLFINNLFGADDLTNASDPSTLAGRIVDPARGYRLRPRTFGATFRTSF